MGCHFTPTILADKLVCVFCMVKLKILQGLCRPAAAVGIYANRYSQVSENKLEILPT